MDGGCVVSVIREGLSVFVCDFALVRGYVGMWVCVFDGNGKEWYDMRYNNCTVS